MRERDNYNQGTRAFFFFSFGEAIKQANNLEGYKHVAEYGNT